jgi:type I restriction enzyme S subunit
LAKPGTQIYVNTDDVIELRLPVPPLPEQRAIATALSDVDALLAALDRLIAKQRDLKQAAMQQLLTGQTRLPGFTGKWETKRLGEIIEEIGDGATPSTNDASNFGGHINWVVIDDIKDEITFTKATLTERGLNACAATLWKPGTLIVSTGATIGEVGIAMIPVATKQGICGIIFDQNQAATRFLKYWFFKNKSVLLAKAQGSTIKEVRAPTLIQIEITLPPLPEQTAIANVLSDMDLELAALEQRRDKTRALKQGMMQELLTGRTRLV